MEVETPPGTARYDPAAPALRLATGTASKPPHGQPRPTLTRVVQFRIFQWTVTAIMRHWRPGESGAAGRCRLCPKCTAYEDGCLKVVMGAVSREDAGLLDTTRSTRQPVVKG